MAEKEGRISLKVKGKRVYFEADLWLLWFLIVGILILVGRPEIITLLERITGLLK